MNEDTIVIERTGNGYRARRMPLYASRREEAVKDWAAVAALILGLLAVMALV